MNSSRIAVRLGGACVLILALAACGGGGSTTSTSDAGASGAGSAAAGDPSTDKLAQVMERGTLVLSTDLGYAPQSMAVDGQERDPNTKCQPTELTANQVTGYDAETGKAVAKVLGVEPCFVTPQWTEIIAGGWGDRWDIAWGSGAITEDRMSRLYVTQPSYSTPAGVFVKTDSPYTKLADMSGKKVGACAGCTMEQYLRDELVLPGVETTRAFTDPVISTFDNEIPGLAAVDKGTIDGFLCSEPVGQGEIDKGLDLRMIEEPAYQSYKTGYIDQKSGLSDTAFVAKVNEAVAQLHADGTLKGLSEKFFAKDYATTASQFDLVALNQVVQ
jgi:polar amino acid transport system substrate-binding protein